MRIRRTLSSCALLVVMALAGSACSLDEFRSHFISKDGTPSDIQDRQQDLTRQDYRDINKVEKLLPKEEATATASLGAPPIPDLAQVLAAPRPPKVANSKLVTISVTDDVPLRDVLFELGRLANVDIEVGPGLDKQGINLRATDRPFNEVIERIADLGGLRYSVSGSAIRVERDTPYIKNYTLDFINIVRSSTSSYSLTTSILSGSSSGGESGASSGAVGESGSSSTITSQAESDLWTSLQSSLTEILSYKAEVGAAKEEAEAKDKDKTKSAATSASAGGSESSGSKSAAPAAAGGDVASNTTDKPSSFVINRQAGVLSVNATQRQHEMVERFLAILARNVSAQVLIEAKIVEVSLRDQFLSGVNWSSVIGNLDGAGVSVGNWQPAGTTGFQLSGGGSNGAITLGVGAGDLETLISLTERFGTTRTLSSPRLSAINNQQAVLTFAENRVFFNCTLPSGSSTTTGSGSTTVTGASVECDTNSVPIGIILSILPSVNLESQEVTLSVRPTLTRQVNEVENPGVRIAAAAYNLNLSATVPVIEVREIDSVMKVKSGGVMVIGGLMEDTTATQNRGIPGVSEVPVFGNLFKSRDEDSSKRELIILIKATIVNSDGNAHPVDRAVIKRFTTDPRPAFPDTK